MPIEKEFARSSPKKDTMLTVGVFDGVHLGHKHLLSRLVEEARQQNLLSAVVTFNPHPQKILSLETKLPFLADLDQRITLIKNEGVEAIVILPFTHELAQLNAYQFVGLLKKYLKMRGLVVGPDFALGRNREGDVNTLRTLGEDMSFTVTTVPPVMINGEVVSSTAIRNALADGNLNRVHDLIGRPFSLHGRVIPGARRGKELGFPTANLDIDPEQALPTEGVYASRAYINGKAYRSMTYIGKNPTFGGRERIVEVYILDYQGDLYGRELKIDIIEWLRGEKQFDTAEELRQQITEDIKQGIATLNSKGKN